MTTIAKISLQANSANARGNPRESANQLVLVAAAETRLRVLSRRADNLLQEMDGVDAIAAKSLRGQAVQLFAVCHRIVCLLGIGDLEGACGVSADDNLDGATLGLTA